MNLPFIKMQALGNDFIIFDRRSLPSETFAPDARALRQWADRRRGVGCDQILILKSSSEATAIMDIFNADGSPAEACGNGTRCAAWWLMQQCGQPTVTLQVGHRLLQAQAIGLNRVEVDIGLPFLDETYSKQAAELFGEEVAVVSVGNPHLVVFRHNLSVQEQQSFFEKVQDSALFLRGTNVEFVSVLTPQHLSLKIWERGVGPTQACGSGACAAAYASFIKKNGSSQVTVSMPGGDVTVRIEDTLKLAGEISFVFSGEIDYN